MFDFWGDGDVQDNPGRSDALMRLGIIGGGAFVLYRFAQSGGLGPTAQQLANSLWGAAAGTTIPVVSIGPGGASVSVPGAVAPGTVSGPYQGRPCPDFVRGVNYVEDQGGGVFGTVIGGQLVYHGDKATAEAQYRTRMGCG